MTFPTHSDEVGEIPTWIVAMLGLMWMAVTLATIAFVGQLGPLG